MMPSLTVSRCSWWSNAWTTSGVLPVFLLPVVQPMDHQRHSDEL